MLATLATSCRQGQSHAATRYTRVCGTCIALKCGSEARAQHVRLRLVLYSTYCRVPFMGPGVRFPKRIPEAGAETRPCTNIQMSFIYPILVTGVTCSGTVLGFAAPRCTTNPYPRSAGIPRVSLILWYVQFLFLFFFYFFIYC